MFAQNPLSEPKLFIIHENEEWTKPLITALESRNIPYANWNMSSAMLDLSRPAPEGVFYNRMSASSHTRGNRFAPEMSIGVLAWLESQSRITFNGRSALNLVTVNVRWPAERMGASTTIFKSKSHSSEEYKSVTCWS